MTLIRNKGDVEVEKKVEPDETSWSQTLCDLNRLIATFIKQPFQHSFLSLTRVTLTPNKGDYASK